jgi:hypothetical protein
MMRTSYLEKDVIFLLKDITGFVKPLSAKTREAAIQSGTSYSEMIPLEYLPTKEYMDIFWQALLNYGTETAHAVGVAAKKIVEQKGDNVVLVSLARAGTPVGILIKHYLQRYYSLNAPHYSISIIRGKGIDNNAVRHLLEYHDSSALQFIDGWTGKGAIVSELEDSLKSYPAISKQLAVLADPAGVAAISGTKEDVLIPSACLNSIVSGLVSRTFHRSDLIGPDDYHGAVYYEDQEGSDISYDFISTIESSFVKPNDLFESEIIKQSSYNGITEAQLIAADFDVADLNLVKPGVGETVRVLLRRLPWKVLVRDADAPEIAPIMRLAGDRGIEVLKYPLVNYKACGLIRNLKQ